MRQPIHHFFGINFIAFLASGHALMMLTSGMTSPNGETCLQAEQSDYESGTSIILDKCLNAIQRADGRELFIYNEKKQLVHDMSQLCVTLKDNVVIDGGQVILDDCESNFLDGRNQFEVLYDNRLRILRAGDFCLTQEGKSVGNADVAFQKLVTSKFSRYREEEHSAEMAVDGNFKTYWVSQEFDYPFGLPESVDFSLDLGGVFKIASIGIHWVFPAASYEIAISLDNQKFERISKILGNSRNITQDFLDGRLARYIKFNFLKPHPSLSVRDNKAIYGISQLAVYSNKLKSSVTQCDEAVLSKDAREKYFFTVVAEFDPSTGLEMNTLRKKFNSIQENIHKEIDKVEGLFNSMEDCVKKMKQREKDTSSLSSHIGNKKTELQLLLYNLTTDNGSLEKSVQTNQREEFADCYEIFLQDKTSISGFYFITSPCDGEKRRVYCDMKTQRTIYLYQTGMNSFEDILDEKDFYHESFDNSKMVTAWEPKDTILFCEKIGMIPFVPQNMKDIDLLEKIKIITTQKDAVSKGNDVENFFPLGFFPNNFETLILGLDLQTKISDWMKPVHPTIDQQVIGLSSESKGLKVSKWPLHLAGVFCSTESTSRIYENIPNVTCETVLRKNSLFEGCPYSSTIIRCLDVCSKKLNNDSRETKLRLFGTYTYRDDSSICLAAEHSGALGKHGLVNVTFLPGFTKYEGSFKNGVNSESYNGVAWDRSFTVSQLQSECKKKNKMKLSSVSFLQTINSHETSTVSQEIKRHIFDYSDEATDSSLKEMLTLNGLQINVDSIAHLIQTAKETIAKSRSYLKPAERVLTELQNVLKTENIELETLLRKIYNYQRSSFNKLHGVVLKTQNLQEDVVFLHEGTKSFNADDLIPLKYNEIESIFTEQGQPILVNTSLHQQILASSVMTPNKKWFFTSLKTETSMFSESHDTGIPRLYYGLKYDDLCNNKDAVESTDLTEASNANNKEKSASSYGVPIYMKNKKLYDGTFSLKYKINNGEGLFAVAFRIKDPSNMYRIEMRQNNGLKSFVKVKNGAEMILSEKNDGGYLNSVWYSIKIELERDLITVFIAEEGSPLKKIFQILDSSFFSGTIGFSAEQVSLVLANLKFDTKACIQSEVPVAPPFPYSCSIFNYTHVENFEYQWKVINPLESSVLGLWSTKPNVAGRSKVIVQYNAVYGSEEQFGTLAILKRHRFCFEGFFSFDFFPQCDGLVGAVVHYNDPLKWAIVEVAPDFVRLRYITSKTEEKKGWGFVNVVEIPSSLKPGAKFLKDQWNSIRITLSNYNVFVRLNNQDIFVAELPRIGVLSNQSRVGLSTWNCGGVSFDNVKLQPLDRTDALENVNHSSKHDVLYRRNGLDTTYIQNQSHTIMSSSLISQKVCRAQHIVDRRQECKKIRGMPNVGGTAEDWDFSLFEWMDFFLLPCQYNYCTECCQKKVKSSVQNAKESSLEAVVTSSLYLDYLNTLESNCVNECSARNDIAQISSDALWGKVKKCFYDLKLNPKLKGSSRAYSTFACLKCCESDQDSKIVQECRHYCFFLHTSLM
ncbi:uncharacterized protein LOC128883269 isoform X2 [Hylaeus volcanicus]|nr:uncharacterized protein LOC128883269 isoform X2 [Hylaeus volcanicus]